MRAVPSSKASNHATKGLVFARTGGGERLASRFGPAAQSEHKLERADQKSGKPRFRSLPAPEKMLATLALSGDPFIRCGCGPMNEIKVQPGEVIMCPHDSRMICTLGQSQLSFGTGFIIRTIGGRHSQSLSLCRATVDLSDFHVHKMG